MTTDDTLHGRIEAELDRREAIAKAAVCEAWTVAERYGEVEVVTVARHARYVGDQSPEAHSVVQAGDFHPAVNPTDAIHIALHDPADALRRYAAARRVLARHRPILWESLTGERRCARCGDTLDCPEIADMADSLGLSTTSEEQP